MTLLECDSVSLSIWFHSWRDSVAVLSPRVSQSSDASHPQRTDTSSTVLCKPWKLAGAH